jgi:SAM-dependent MidA family methyltransferase
MSGDDDAFRPAEQLAAQLRERIRSEGPLPVSVFMAEALLDPMAGFYATKDPLSAGGDFITAPEISQMFGELAGLWAAEVWSQMGAPDPVRLIELGPGTGRMMSDVLRAARAAPGFLDAASLHLIEASAALKMVQGRTLAQAPLQARWESGLEKVPAGPSIILGNEFLDCLPIRQAVRHKGVWRERVVGLSPDDPGRFIFGLGPHLSDADIHEIAPTLREAEDGTLVELRLGDATVIDQIAARFKAHPGYALFIDYGSDAPEAGDTLQALKSHQKVDPLEAPGTADLTAWVDFDRIARLARNAGLDVYGIGRQGDFLKGLGIETRAAALARTQDEAGQAKIARQLHRLTAREEMGDLFKAVAICSPGLAPAPGLERFDA